MQLGLRGEDGRKGCATRCIDLHGLTRRDLALDGVVVALIGHARRAARIQGERRSVRVVPSEHVAIAVSPIR